MKTPAQIFGIGSNRLATAPIQFIEISSKGTKQDALLTLNAGICLRDGLGGESVGASKYGDGDWADGGEATFRQLS